MIGNFFLYDPAGDGFQIFPTMEQRDVAAVGAVERRRADEAVHLDDRAPAEQRAPLGMDR